MTAQNPSGQLAGAVLNARWRLVKLLGEGGMGAVYEADGLRGEGKRAIKLLHPEFVKEEQILSRFFDEARAAQSLRHPNVAQVFEAQTAEDGTPYLVMELLSGTPLSAWIDSAKGIAPQQAAPVIIGVLSALQMAHNQRIVHRDLKPDNLFLARDARGQPVVKVLDFGIAKVMDAAGGMGQKTRTGVLLGTPGYMSPEQIKNSKGVDARSDLWSLGIIFYEMLTNQQPFPADNEFARLTAVLTEEIRPIEQAAPHLAHWSAFFKKALAKDAAQRFQSADEMSYAVQQMINPNANAFGPTTPAPAAPATQQPQRGTGTEAFSMPASMQHGAPSAQAQYSTPHGQLMQQQRPPSQPPPAAYPQTPQPQAQANPSYAPPPAGVPTHVSQQRPTGTPTVHEAQPQVSVVAAPRTGAAWWIVAVVGAVCFGLGFLVGFLIHGSPDAPSPKPAATSPHK